MCSMFLKNLKEITSGGLKEEVADMKTCLQQINSNNKTHVLRKRVQVQQRPETVAVKKTFLRKKKSTGIPN